MHDRIGRRRRRAGPVKDALILVAGLAASAAALAAIFGALRLLSALMERIAHFTSRVCSEPFRRHILWMHGGREGMHLERERCVACGGMGVQVMLGGRYTIIPPELRDRQPDGSHPRLANSRRCPRCHGLGYRWILFPD
jgi:hypothetical protein